jgi:hypothetical protein
MTDGVAKGKDKYRLPLQQETCWVLGVKLAKHALETRTNRLANSNQDISLDGQLEPFQVIIFCILRQLGE